MIVFETERLVVREYVPEDAAFIFDMYSREEVMRYLWTQPLRTLEDASVRIERFRKGYAADPRQGAWALTLRGSGEIVGTVIVKRAWLSIATPMPQDAAALSSYEPVLADEWEVGWHLHPARWGHGYATEAARHALQRAFASGITELIALIDPLNAASRRVAERLGMRYVGRTNRYYSYSLELDLFTSRGVNEGNDSAVPSRQVTASASQLLAGKNDPCPRQGLSAVGVCPNRPSSFVKLFLEREMRSREAA